MDWDSDCICKSDIKGLEECVRNFASHEAKASASEESSFIHNRIR